MAVDAVGIDGGGGREVARDILLACADEPGIAVCTVFLTDATLASQLSSQDGLSVRLLPRRRLMWRAWWLLIGFKRARRSIHAGPSLHLANLALRRNPDGAAALMHQLNAIEAPEGSQLPVKTRIRYWLLGALVARTCAYADVIFVQTNAVQASLRRKLSSDAACKVVVAPPVPPTSLRAMGGAAESGSLGAGLNFLYIGSAAPHKNVRVLLEAWPEVHASHATASLSLTLGQHDVPEAGTIPGVQFHGHVDRATVAGLLDSATALVMPSLTETVGLPMLEAMELGVPIIAADRPYAHAVCENAALFFDPLSPASLAEACHAVATDDELRQQLINKGRERIDELRSHRGDRAIARWIAGARTLRDRE